MSKKKIITCAVIFAVLLLCCLTVVVGVYLFVRQINMDTNQNILDDREVYIRIDNQTDRDIAAVHLGSLLLRQNSYSTYSYTTRYLHIQSNSQSKYKQVNNIPEGYDEIDISMTNNDYGRLSTLTDIIPSKYMSPTKWYTPILKEYREEDGLIAGYYTLTIINFTNDYKNNVNITITKDK